MVGSQLPELLEVTDQEASGLAVSDTGAGSLNEGCSADWAGLGELAQEGIVDAKYLEETGPKLFHRALDQLKSTMEMEMNAQLASQIQKFTTETETNVINQGGQRRKRKFEQIQNKYSFKEFSSQYELIMRESVGKCNKKLAAETPSQSSTPTVNLGHQYSEKNALFEQCLQAKLQTFVDKFVHLALEEAELFIKENFLIKPNKTIQKKAGKKKNADPYAGKQMVYISDDDVNLQTHKDDEYLITPNLPAQRLLFGEPVQLESWEEERWRDFEMWVAQKGYEPVSDIFKTSERLGFQIMYFYGFSMSGSSDEAIFEAAYRNLKVIDEYDFPTDPEKLRKFIDTGAIRIIGRLTELGHQPVIDINVNKIIKEVVQKHKASSKELELYITFWFLWVKNYMMLPGKIERMFLIFDLKDIKVRELPLTKLQPLFKIQEELFKGRPFRNVFVNQSWFLTTVLNLISSWFNEHTREIIQYTNEEDTFQTLLQFMSADQIEQKYGGNKPSSRQFFPPLY